MNSYQIKTFMLFTLILSISTYSLFCSDDNLERLNNHFQNFEYEKAINLAEQILKNQKLTDDEKLRVFIIKGISEYNTNKMVSSKITFAELIIFNKNVKLDEGEVSPKIIAFFNELKNEILEKNI